MSDGEALQRLGYKQELHRTLGGFANFALSFSVISILTGAVSLYGHGLTYGGPLVMSVGWPVVSLLTLTIAASLAELASAYPTAGALYHWAAILGGREAGWVTAWLNTLGQFAITASIDYGLAEFVATLLGWPTARAYVMPLCVAFLVSHAVLNHVGVKLVGALNMVSAWYHVVGVALILGAVVFFAPKAPFSFLLELHTKDAMVPWWSFAVALLQPAWTFTGYDASAHASEETVDAARAAPRGMMTAVIASALAGWVLVVSVTLAVTSLPAALADSNPFLYVLRTSLGAWGTALVWVAVGAMWFCGLASVTSNSRMLFAFARDGGLPFSAALARVSPTFRSPHVAIWVSVVMAAALALWADGLAVMTALSTTALYASYGLPIAMALWARSKGTLQRGPWQLGRASTALNVVALGWGAVVIVIMSVPPNDKAGLAFGATLVLLAGLWFGVARQRFRPAWLAGDRAKG